MIREWVISVPAGWSRLRIAGLPKSINAMYLRAGDLMGHADVQTTLFGSAVAATWQQETEERGRKP